MKEDYQQDRQERKERPHGNGVEHREDEALALLHQSESRLAEAQRLAQLGHWEWDVSADKVVWSNELYRIFGLKQGEFAATYQAFLDHVHPDERDYVAGQVEKTYTTGEPLDFYHRIIRPNGEVRLVHAAAQATRDEQGAVSRLIGIAQDVTEQKKIEQQLEESVRRLTALDETAQTIAATVDLSQILDRVLALLRPLLGAEAMLIFLQQKEELVVSAVNREGIAHLMGRRIPLDAGIAGDVWHSGQAMLLRGDQCQRALAPQLLGAAAHVPQAILAVPIRWQDRLLGVLEATDNDPDAFNIDDVHLLETAAAWTAIAITNSRQYQRLQQQVRESEAMAAISRAFTETLEPVQVLQLIAQVALDVIPNVDWSAIHLLQGEPSKLKLVASAGLELNDLVYDLDPDDGVIGEVMKLGNALSIPDLQLDSRRLPIDEALQIHCLLVAPVQGRERRLGTLTVQCQVPETFTADDERLLTILGVQAGMAIENAHLYEAEQRARKAAERRREGMRRLARQVVVAQEEERQSIARELHDETGQALTSFKIGLEMLRSQLPEDIASVREDMEMLIELADKTMSNLRQLAHNLRPPGLDAFGLDTALAGLCHDYVSYTKIPVLYKGIELPPLPTLTSLSLYRLVQEALTNATRHAQATQIEVQLQCDAEEIVIAISDNGLGFNPPSDLEAAEDYRGAGLRGMYERLVMINGQLEIYSTPGKGTRLVARAPLTEGS